MSRAARLLALALLVATAGGCASALRKSASLDELMTRASAPVDDPSTADALFAAAEASFATAQIDGVRRSVGQWLAAYRADSARPAALAEAAKAWGWLADRSEAAADRDVAAVSAVQTAQLCTRDHPDSILCRYALALSFGVQAREKRRTGLDALPRIVELLEEVIAEDPSLDSAGPHRVLALVYLRAPRWPLGPGDADLGLEQAEAAVDLFPDFPPNQLALGEAWAAIDEPDEARSAYEKALNLGKAALDAGTAAAATWIEQARAALEEIED